MTVELLRKFVDSSYLRNDFEYGVAKIKKRDEAQFQDVRKYHGYRSLPTSEAPYIFKPYLFAKVVGTEDWRRASDPRKIGGQLGILALTNPVVFFLTMAKRVAEAVLIVTGIFFDTFGELYPQKVTDNLTKAFVTCLNANLEKKKKECQELWETVKNDFHCAAVMELAAIHGLLNVEDATRMQFLFGDKERQWNRYKEAEAFKHIEVDETAPYGVSMISSKWYMTKTSLLWTFVVKEAAADNSAELARLIGENRAYTRDVGTPPIEWLGNVVDNLSEARVNRRDIDLLQDVIGSSPKFKAMNIRELTASSRLKYRFLSKCFLEIFETRTSGFIQYQCAYPLSPEKQGRVEVMVRTVKGSIEEAWQAFEGT